MKRLLAAASALTVLAIASTASAADLAARTAPVYSKAPEYVPVVNSWAGLYIGGNIGYGWGSNNTDYVEANNADFDPFSNRIKPAGVFGGGQLGYNWQMNSFLVGLETDIQGSGIKGAFDDGFNPTSQKLSWFGTVRGRIGVLVAPQVLLYGTGGLAYGNVNDDANVIFRLGDGTIASQNPGSLSGVRTGWTAGGGIEWMFSKGWSVKAEYLHIDLGNPSVVGVNTEGGPAVTYTFHNQFDTVKAGVNYYFN